MPAISLSDVPLRLPAAEIFRQDSLYNGYIKKAMALLATLGFSDALLPRDLRQPDTIRRLHEALRAVLYSLASSHGPFPIAQLMPSIGEIVNPRADRAPTPITTVITAIPYLSVLHVEFADKVQATRPQAASLLSRALGLLVRHVPLSSYMDIIHNVTEWHPAERQHKWLGGATISARKELFLKRITTPTDPYAPETVRLDSLRSRHLLSPGELQWLLDATDIAVHFRRHGEPTYPNGYFSAQDPYGETFSDIGDNEPWQFSHYFVISNNDALCDEFLDCIRNYNDMPAFVDQIHGTPHLQQMLSRWRHIAMLTAALKDAPSIWGYKEGTKIDRQ